MPPPRHTTGSSDKSAGKSSNQRRATRTTARKPSTARPRRAARTAPAPRIRFAVVGLGYIAQSAMLPAFASVTGICELAALVSDDPVKLARLGRRYRVERTYSYEHYDECLASGIDAVYIALPNSMHHEYAVRAARAGIHVLCEKPMAVSVDACAAMIEAAEAGRAKLMIGYRLHFERANLRAVALASAEKLGDLRFFNSTFSMQVRAGDIRLRAGLGGGTVSDLGIYCINAARYLFRAEPTEVFAMSARTPDGRFTEVDEMVAVVMRFPGDRLATFTSSFGSATTAAYDLIGTRGSLRVDPAYEYTEKLTHCLTIDGRTTEKTFPIRGQFAAELKYFAECIRADVQPEPSGAEGLADVRVITAILRSAQEGRPVAITAPADDLVRPQPDQVIDLPAPSRKPALVHALPPSPED